MGSPMLLVASYASIDGYGAFALNTSARAPPE